VTCRHGSTTTNDDARFCATGLTGCRVEAFLMDGRSSASGRPGIDVAHGRMEKMKNEGHTPSPHIFTRVKSVGVHINTVRPTVCTRTRTVPRSRKYSTTYGIVVLATFKPRDHRLVFTRAMPRILAPCYRMLPPSFN